MRRLLAAAAITLLPAATAHADPTTYTVEAADSDGIISFWHPTFTQMQLGGTQCPCEKVEYPSTGMPWDNQTGVNEIQKLVTEGTIAAGDTLMGFSLGAQVVSQYMSSHTLPAGVKVLLVGDTFWRNQQFVNAGVGVPWNTPNQITMIAREYDGWSDEPDNNTAPGYWTALINGMIGGLSIHNYAAAQLDNPNNVITTRGNFTAILVPTQKMPNGNESDRTEIDGAYTRPAPTQQQLDNSGPEQANGVPAQTPEPIAQ